MLIEDVIEKIRPHPAIYLGDLSATALCIFLMGYLTALDDLHAEDPRNGQLLKSFDTWLRTKLNDTTNNSWAQKIERTCTQKSHSLSRFYDLYDEFKTQCLP